MADDFDFPTYVPPRRPIPTDKCSHCGATEGVGLEDSRTCYDPPPPTYWELILDEIEDPNAPVALCRECAAQHHDYWDAMWDEYNASRG